MPAASAVGTLNRWNTRSPFAHAKYMHRVVPSGKRVAVEAGTRRAHLSARVFLERLASPDVYPRLEMKFYPSLDAFLPDLSHHRRYERHQSGTRKGPIQELL
jgi:hypothetical protein